MPLRGIIVSEIIDFISHPEKPWVARMSGEITLTVGFCSEQLRAGENKKANVSSPNG